MVARVFDFLRHPLTVVVLILLGLYLGFTRVVSPPVPHWQLVMYMTFCTMGVLLAATFDDATTRRLFAPILAVLGNPGLGWARVVVMLPIIAGTAWLTYGWAKQSFEAPVEQRTVHPAPPTNFKVYDKTLDLVELVNPFRAGAARGGPEYAEILSQGRDLYYQNCIYCHGDNLDGTGHFAAAFNPRPANFQDVGTIAQLQESFLFWRITTGAPGLPREGAPWASAMPAWHEMLAEDEVWKIISFLYDFTGFEPRAWELEEVAVPEAAEADEGTSRIQDGGGPAEIEQIYLNRCAQCHGEEGAGDGPAADFLYPKPRDFTLGVFKYKTSHADSEFPYDQDMHKTIRVGLPGTSMPAWENILSETEIDGLIGLIREFGEWDEESDEDLGTEPIEFGERIETTPESVALGAQVFEKACVQCHGAAGRGNVTSGKKLEDDWGNRIWPRNLTRPETWRWTRDSTDIFQRISAGIRGTPMPEHSTTMSADDRWHVANYVMTLRDSAVPLSTGETVLRGVRIIGDLPSDPDDSAWDRAEPITFPLVGNVIKDPRLFFSLNDTVTVRALFNGKALALRLDIDDRTYSVPGNEEELRYRQGDVEPTPDAVAVQLPAQMPETSEKPWFRHGDRKHSVNMWYWRAPSVEPQTDEQLMVLDAAGPHEPPVPREGPTELSGASQWQDGQWRVVISRPLATDDGRDLQIDPGRYIPIAFANWDGWAGQQGSRHTLTSWYWLLLEPEKRPLFVFGTTGGSGALAGLMFLAVVRRQRRRFTGEASRD
ncbi:MAG: c-type cytochrome [Alphaproteobacteria bacterium]